MQITFIHHDGLHISSQATLSQLMTDENLQEFATGLILQALEPHLSHPPVEAEVWTITELLHHSGSELNAFLAALLALDAEIHMMVADERRIMPLAGFLTYRSSFPPSRFPFSTVCLPPLNPDGHYFFSMVGEGRSISIRLDLHPRLKVAGHVRLAVGGSTRPPKRLKAAEQRVERKILTSDLIKLALSEPSLPLNKAEYEAFTHALHDIIRTVAP